MRYYIGVDPGMSGYVAVLDNWYELILTEPFPCVAARKGRTIDVPAVARMFTKMKEELPFTNKGYMAGIERVGPMPGSAKAMFHFGGSYFAIQVALCAASIPVELIEPRVWMKKFSLLKTPKDASRAVAGRLYPAEDFSLKTKHVDKAEAVLIARYLAEKDRGKTVLIRRPT